MDDIDRLVEGEGGYDYLVRSISIVTLLCERGILRELLESGRLSEEEVAQRANAIRRRFPGFATKEKQRKKKKPDADPSSQ